MYVRTNAYIYLGRTLVHARLLSLFVYAVFLVSLGSHLRSKLHHCLIFIFDALSPFYFVCLCACLFACLFVYCITLLIAPL